MKKRAKCNFKKSEILITHRGEHKRSEINLKGVRVRASLRSSGRFLLYCTVTSLLQMIKFNLEMQPMHSNVQLKLKSQHCTFILHYLLFIFLFNSQFFQNFDSVLFIYLPTITSFRYSLFIKILIVLAAYIIIVDVLTEGLMIFDH